MYAHTYRDWRRVPAVGYSSRPCMQWTQSVTGGPPELTYTQRCPRGFACPLAHGAKEQLYHPQFYKTSPCSEANCKRMALCAFTHEGRDVRKPCGGGPTSKELREPLKQALSILERYQPTFWNPPRYHALEVDETIKTSSLNRNMGFGSGHCGTLQMPAALLQSSTTQAQNQWSKPALPHCASSDNQDWDQESKKPQSNHWRVESESSSGDTDRNDNYSQSVSNDDASAEAALSAVVNAASSMTSSMQPTFQYPNQFQYQFVQYLPEGPYLPQVMPSQEDQWAMQCQYQQAAYWGGQWGAGAAAISGAATIPAGTIITQQTLWGADGTQMVQVPAQLENGMSPMNGMNGMTPGCTGSVDVSDCSSPICHGPLTITNGSAVNMDGSPVFHSPIESGSPHRSTFAMSPQQPVFHAAHAQHSPDQMHAQRSSDQMTGSPDRRSLSKQFSEKFTDLSESLGNSPSRSGYGYAEAWRTPSSPGSPALSGANTEAPPSPRSPRLPGDDSVPTGPSSSQADEEGCWLGIDPAPHLGFSSLDVKGHLDQASPPDAFMRGKSKDDKQLKNSPGYMSKQNRGDMMGPPFNQHQAGVSLIMRTQERHMSLPWV